MKVYVVYSGSYSDKTIEAVFLNLEQTEKCCALHNRCDYINCCDCYIETYDTSDNSIIDIGNEIIGYVYEVYKSPIDFKLAARESHVSFKSAFERAMNKPNNVNKKYVWINRRDERLAIKVYQDKEAEAKANASGIT